ncbi:MAG TPA: ATP-binding protein [Candidatus Binatia bacterium]|nr:ATP-binding protein [Candidatus Binatia bacterium]
MKSVFEPRDNRSAAALAGGLAAVLLVLGLLMAVFNESEFKRQQARELGVQAQIIAASVAPALMFYNSANAQEYLNALQANPAISAAAVYDARGVRVAAFHRADRPAPPERFAVGPPRFEGRTVISSTAVERDGEILGSVFLQTDVESLLQRVSRYAAIGILILLAALVIFVLGTAQGALRAANAELESRARQLEQEIEQRERAEEALLQSRKLEAIGQLVGGVAHDFNNLLTVVLSGLRLIERHPDGERRVATMEAMRQAVERGAGLTRQLLAFARRQSLKLEAIDVGAQLQGMRELLARSLRADILVDIVTPGDLWPVKTDPTQFELAVLNLAVNARDAMPKGGVLTIVAANAASAQGDFVQVSVCDTGMGISAEVLERVFEPYFTTKQAGQGTGLGLSQVYGFANQSGGSVSIESVINQGTRVTLRLPRAEEMPARPAAAQASPAAGPRLTGKSVLVVEDEDAVAQMVDDMLEQLGCTSLRAANAEAALHALAERRFDLVFSDIIMPGEMNGHELAQELRRRHPDMPIVLTTGYSGSADIDSAFPVLRKPYQLDDLESILQAALADREVRVAS